MTRTLGPIRSGCESSSHATYAWVGLAFGEADDITIDDRRPGRNRLALGLAAIPFALHLAALTQYDFFRDELYFIVCGRHPALGYVDQPPLVPLLAAASQSAGESLWLLRIIPALFHVGAVLAACAVARLLGGGRSAQVLAAVATGLAPLLLAVTGTLGTTSLEPLTWTLVAYATLRAVLRAQPRWWIVAGLTAGLGLENKYTIAFWLVTIIAAVALAGPRETFARRQFWLGAAVAITLGAPSIMWQALHGWPFLQLLHAGASGKNVVVAPLSWLINQVVVTSPGFALLALAGSIALSTDARTRFLGVAVLLLFATLITLHAKDYYLAGVYPLLFAAGGAGLERAVSDRFVRAAYVTLALTVALVGAPLALPLLSESRYIVYARRLDAVLHMHPTQNEHHRTTLLPQYFADMHGWRELADRVAAAERSLSPSERAQAAVFAQNYGEAAAVDVFGDGRLAVISGHNNYYLWGPYGAHAVLIIIGSTKRDNERLYRDVRQVATVRSEYAMPYENDLPIFIAREPKADLMRAWPDLRHYD